MGGPSVLVVPQLGVHPKVGYTTSNITVNNSTTLVNATGMSFVAPANTKWAIRVMNMWDTDSVADITFDWSLPSGTTGQWADTPLDNRITTPIGTPMSINSAGGGETDLLHIYMHIGSVSGTVQFQFAQKVATVVNTTLFAGSFLIAYPLG